MALRAAPELRRVSPAADEHRYLPVHRRPVYSGPALSRQRRFALLVTNVPGPPVPLYLAGAPLLEVFPVMPLVGNETLNVAALSYAGQLNLTAVADGDACPDVDVFAPGVRSALDKLAQSAVTAAC